MREKGAMANIPPRSNRPSKPYFSTWLYRQRYLIELTFSKLKHFRRVAALTTSWPKTSSPVVQLASMRLWLRVYKSTTYFVGTN